MFGKINDNTLQNLMKINDNTIPEITTISKINSNPQNDNIIDTVNSKVE